MLAQDRVRMIGVCFGHQIIARAMGVTVGRNDDGWESAVNEVQLTAKGKELFQKEKIVSIIQSEGWQLLKTRSEPPPNAS